MGKHDYASRQNTFQGRHGGSLTWAAAGGGPRDYCADAECHHFAW